MRRSEAAMIAHLDAIEARLTVLLMEIKQQLNRQSEQIAGMMVDHATHRHEDDD